MEQNAQRFMQMLRSELTGEELPAALFQDMTAQEWSELFALAKRQDVAHLLGDLIARDELPVPEGPKNALDEAFCEAVLRAQLFEGELKNVGAVFQKAGIPYLPLKGAVIRRLYPEPWMRTSCDIDILIRKEDIKQAEKRLTEDLGYRFEKHAYHELSLYSPSGVHLELHFSIEENTPMIDGVLKRSWDYAEPVAKGSYCYRFQPAFLLFYAVAHAAYHFNGGGCGVRPLIDQYLLEQKVEYDRKVYAALIEEAGLPTFETQFSNLWQVWFAAGEHTDLTRRMESYILSAGIYGSSENRETVRLIQKRGRFRSFISRVWLPYRELIIKYPSLKGKRILQPFYEIRRWFSLLNPKRFKRVKNEMKTNLRVDETQKEQIQTLLRDLELPI